MGATNSALGGAAAGIGVAALAKSSAAAAGKAGAAAFPPLYPVIGLAAVGYIGYKVYEKNKRPASNSQPIVLKKHREYNKTSDKPLFPAWNADKKENLSQHGKVYLPLKNEQQQTEHSWVIGSSLDPQLFSLPSLQYSVVCKLDNVSQGTLHIYARHFSQFQHLFSEAVDQLSEEALSYLKHCERATTNPFIAYMELQEHLERFENDRAILERIQYELFYFIVGQMTPDNFLGIQIDSDGRLLCHFQCGKRVLRVVLGRTTYKPLTNDSNPFKEIITAYFIKPNEAKGILNLKKLL
uniref:Uncharacterized protein n=1 Tax=Panagrolaimus sp. ES5 TaxID=591445 RepID=A0AC34FWK8_9BILA